jgi:hypothetical protein
MFGHFPVQRTGTFASSDTMLYQCFKNMPCAFLFTEIILNPLYSRKLTHFCFPI